VSVRADPSLRDTRFAQEVEGAGYFTIAEALANASKHAAATSVEVSLARADGSLELSVRDDGQGFDPETAIGEGLANLAERLSALGGRLDVRSAPGAGTTVSASLEVTGA
jgi:signal transduction histidine kinase